jgi:hypothetical protein
LSLKVRPQATLFRDHTSSFDGRERPCYEELEQGFATILEDTDGTEALDLTLETADGVATFVIDELKGDWGREGRLIPWPEATTWVERFGSLPTCWLV